MSVLDYATSNTMWGWLGKPDTAPSAIGLNLNLATLALAMGFILPRDRTLNKVRVYVNSKSGSPGTGSCRCDIYSDTGAGVPNASLANSTTVTAAPTAGAFLEFTGFTLALTKGTQYHIVITNIDATPASNNFLIGYQGQTQPNPWIGDSGGRYGFHKRHSTTSGVSWGTTNTNICGWRLDFSNGDVYGCPIWNAGLATTTGVYSTREFGAKFTTPLNQRMTASAAMMRFYRLGSPTGNFRYKLYKGSTPSLVATTLEIPCSQFSTSTSTGGLGLPFETPITLEANTIYRLVGSESTQSDASTNAMNGAAVFNMLNDATDKSLKPLGGTLSKTYFDGSTWTDTDTDFVEFGLALLYGAEFAVLASQNIAH